MSSAHDQLWFRHEKTCWALGDIKQFHGKEVELKSVSDGRVYRVPLVDTHPCDASHLLDSDDIALMNNMHEGPLLTLLQRRYECDKIYTFTGDILISINPYKAIPGLYDIPDVLPDYNELHTPHVYAVAESAYRMMLEESNPAKKNQSLIVSGESGAGKTEACKHIMRYLATLSERDCSKKQRAASAVNVINSVEKRVLDCNPFLEAFGNAKTVRNDNSSRFGKFLKIEYDDGRILGARIRHYLLEKARVVAPQHGERNYHIFYQLTRGCSATEAAALKLGPPDDFAYLNKGGAAAMSIAGVDDAQDFAVVREALASVGIEPEAQTRMFTVLAALLHMGNIEFVDNDKEEAVIANPAVAAIAAEQLGVPYLPTKLIRRLVKVKGRSSAYEVNLTAKQAAAARDALSKTTYERMFTWLIGRCNVMLASNARPSGFIGILDIFGFEIFEMNSFEQLCINYANEKLQNLFNHHIFIMEQEQYSAEGVDMTTIEFINNQPCVDLIEKKPTGILVMLDEICYLGRSTTDAAFLEQLDKTHKGKSAYYGNPKKKSLDRFSIVHFAGEVTYCVDSFIEKNNDTLYTDLEELMTASTVTFVADLFNDDALGDAHFEGSGDEATKSAGHAAPRNQSASTIASKFKKQLSALNDTLLATTPHYVRCVKPNKLKAPELFDHPMILAQLLYAGVLETVRIRRQGYPFRETYAEFWRRACRIGFPVLVPACAALPLPPPPRFELVAGEMQDITLTKDVLATCRKGCELLCAAMLKPSMWTTGKTKLFLKDMALDHITAMYRKYHALRILAWWKMAKQRRIYVRFRRAVITCKKLYKGKLLRRKFQAVAKHITILQAHIRQRLQRRKYLRIMRIRANAAVKAQSICKMHIARKRFTQFSSALLKLQACFHARRARLRFKRMRKSAILIQSAVRMLLAKRRFQRIRRARMYGAVIIQAKWRGWVARRRFLKLRRAITKAAASWKRLVAVRHLRKRFACLLRVQAFARRLLARIRFRKALWAIIRIQAWYKCQRQKLEYKRIQRAADRIRRAVLAYHRSKVLATWVQEVFAAAMWGDVEEMRSLLYCEEEVFRHLRDIPLSERVKLRNKDDGMKSLLHAAAASGRPDSVQMLVNMGADITARDAVGATPAHKAAAIGDSHLPVLKLLVGAASMQHASDVSVVSLLNSNTAANESTLDVAINKYRSSTRKDHDLTVRFLLENGATSNSVAGGKAAVESLLSQPRGEQMLAAAAMAREREVMERRAKERREDPHYQFLYLSEQERIKRAEKLKPTPAVAPESSSPAADVAAGKGAMAMPTAPTPQPAATTASVAPSSSPQLVAQYKHAHDNGDAASHAVEKVSPRASVLPSNTGMHSPIPVQERQTPAAASPAAVNRGSVNLSLTPNATSAATPGPDMQRDSVINFFVRSESSKDLSLSASRADLLHTYGSEMMSPPPSRPSSVQYGVGSMDKLLVSSYTPVADTNNRSSVDGRLPLVTDTIPLRQSTHDIVSPSMSSSPVLRSVATEVMPKGRRGSTAPLFGPGLVRSTTQHQHGPSSGNAANGNWRKSARMSAKVPEPVQEAPMWSVHQSSSTGLLYYFNRQTSVTQWEEPDDFDGTYEPWQLELLRYGVQSGVNSSSSASLLSKRASTRSIDGRAASIDAVDSKVASSGVGLGRRTVGLGRNGWAAAVDEEGYVYYFHTQSGSTQWERPTDF